MNMNNMKRNCLLLLLMMYSFVGFAQSDAIPAAYLKDSLPALIVKTKALLDKAYMAQTLLATIDTLPGWEGYPVKLYQYQTGNDLYTGKPKIAKIYLLNPSPEKLAMWIISASWEAKKSVDAKYTNKILQWIRGQSGAQFPVKGIVYEDQYTKDFQEPYLFKDGVTVYLQDSTKWAQNKTCTPEQIEAYLHVTNQDLKPHTGKYARIASTTREDYKACGGTEDIGDANDRKLKWLDVVRELYKKAWNSDRNELISCWAKNHLE